MPLQNATYNVNENTFELYPAGIYEARLVDLEEKTLTIQATNETRDVIEWTFEVISGPQKGKEIKDICAKPTNGLGPKTKMRQWIEGILGQSLQGRTKPVDPNRLIGKECYITLFRGPNQVGKDVNKITALSPRTRSAPSIVPPPTPAPANNGDGHSDEDPLF